MTPLAHPSVAPDEQPLVLMAQESTHETARSVPIEVAPSVSALLAALTQATNNDVAGVTAGADSQAASSTYRAAVDCQ